VADGVYHASGLVPLPSVRAAQKRGRVSLKWNGTKVTEAQLTMLTHLRELGFTFSVEYTLILGRGWRFDILAFAPVKSRPFLIECDGGKYRGGHRRGDKIDDENSKKNTATLMGFRVLTFTNDFILDGRAKEFLRSNLGL